MVTNNMKLFPIVVLLPICVICTIRNGPQLQKRLAEMNQYCRRSHGRIINSKPAKYGQFPYQASVRGVNGKHHYDCGGSLIGPTWILTSADCIRGQKYWVVRLGSIYRHRGMIHMRSYKGITNPHFSKCMDHDIHNMGLIELPRAVKFTDSIRSIRLPRSPEKTISLAQICVVINGWGLTQYGVAQFIKPKLRYGNLITIPNKECKESQECIIGTTLCAIGHASMCHGDNGGPLTYKEPDGKETLVGVLSMMDKDCILGKPTVFTRTVYYLKWITNITGIPIRT